MLDLEVDSSALRLQAEGLAGSEAVEQDAASIVVPCGPFELGALTARLLPAALSQLPNPRVERDINANGVEISNLQVHPYFAEAANEKIQQLGKGVPAGHSAVHLKSMIKQYQFFTPDFPESLQDAYELLNDSMYSKWEVPPMSTDQRWLKRVDQLIPAAAEFVAKRGCAFLPHLTATYRTKLVQIFHPSNQEEDSFTRKTVMTQPSRDTQMRAIGELKRFARYIHRQQGTDSPFFRAHHQYCQVRFVPTTFG